MAGKKQGFGTFGGVFTPCTLTILGVIMFLRFGQVVGNAGVVYALLIVLASKVITGLTSLSLAAIATNTRVKGGGAYYLISRSLGVEFGGAIGIVFFLAQAISIAMYVIGFTEALVATFPTFADHFTGVATFFNLLTFICVYIGAGWTIKVQYGILAVLAAALVSFYGGAALAFDPGLLAENLGAGFAEGESFFSMFALFFPAVTGIMAGANMSGDLARPSRSIPRGTLLAVVVTGVIYLSQAALLGAVRPRGELIGDSMIIEKIAAWPLLITAGVFAATLSSALGSMMGAPRILQAFARDEVFPSLAFFGQGSGKSDEPRRATVLSFVIAQVCILLGDLNAIAPIITMFFMITYGLLNLATFYEAFTRNPSYRPTFRYCHWSTALLGALGCLAVMFLVNWLWALVAILLIAGLHRYISWREIESRWGDLQSGVAFERARKSLLRLEQQAYHPKNWRPVLLALSGVAWNRPQLAIYGHWLTAGRGILSLGHVVSGEAATHAERKSRFEAALRKFIASQRLEAFPATVVAADRAAGIEALVQCYGIGGLRPNTVLLGWPSQDDRAEVFGATLRLIQRLERSLVVVRAGPAPEGSAWEVPEGTIDVWWRGMANGALMLLLAHLLHQNPRWRNNRLRLLRVVNQEAGLEEVRKHLVELASASRIHAEPVVVAAPEVLPAIHQESAHAAVVLFGFEPPAEGDEEASFARLTALAGSLPRVLFVKSAGGMALES